MTQSKTHQSPPRARTAALLLLSVAAATGLGASGASGEVASAEAGSLVAE